jgi:hypothetical protein
MGDRDGLPSIHDPRLPRIAWTVQFFPLKTFGQNTKARMELEQERASILNWQLATVLTGFLFCLETARFRCFLFLNWPWCDPSIGLVPWALGVPRVVLGPAKTFVPPEAK